MSQNAEPGFAGDPVPVCAIGASAGGLDALRKFFSAIGDDLGIAFVVIVHLSPEHPSVLAEILADCTQWGCCRSPIRRR